MLGPEIEGEIAQMSFGHGGLASAAGSTPAADTGSSLVDNDRGRHSRPIVIGAPRSKQSGVLCKEIDVGCLSWLQEHGSPTRIERVSIFDLCRGDPCGVATSFIRSCHLPGAAITLAIFCFLSASIADTNSARYLNGAAAA
jgi:hypothetical protein